MSKYDDAPFRRAQEESNQRERDQGCICDLPEPRGKIDKMHGHEFHPKKECPLHGWMVE